MQKPLKDINLEIGRRIQAKRKAMNLTRDALASLSGYSSNFIQEVERGRSGLSSESIRAIATALKTSTDSILFGESTDNFTYLTRLLESVPEDKRRHIVRIVEEAVECSREV